MDPTLSEYASIKIGLYAKYTVFSKPLLNPCCIILHAESEICLTFYSILLVPIERDPPVTAASRSGFIRLVFSLPCLEKIKDFRGKQSLTAALRSFFSSGGMKQNLQAVEGGSASSVMSVCMQMV